MDAVNAKKARPHEREGHFCWNEGKAGAMRLRWVGLLVGIGITVLTVTASLTGFVNEFFPPGLVFAFLVYLPALPISFFVWLVGFPMTFVVYGFSVLFWGTFGYWLGSRLERPIGKKPLKTTSDLE